MVYKEETYAGRSVKIKMESGRGAWDLMLAGPGRYYGKGVYEVSEGTLRVLDKKGIPYKRIE